MGYSEASRAGIKVNGKSWRAEILGLPGINDEIEGHLQSLTPDAVTKIEACLRRVHALFAPHFTDDNGTSGEVEALEWFEQESPAYEFEEGLLNEWVQEYDFRLGELYDFADYNRIWVSPGMNAAKPSHQSDEA